LSFAPRSFVPVALHEQSMAKLRRQVDSSLDYSITESGLPTDTYFAQDSPVLATGVRYQCSI